MNIKNTKIDLTACPSCIHFNIRKAMRATSQHYDKMLAPSGLRGTQFTILTALSISEPISITDLAEELVMERTTLTRNLKPLEKEDLLQIIPNIHDRRSRQIKITKAGRKTQKMALPYWRKAQQQMVNFMGKSNSKQFISDLRLAATSHEKL